MNFSVFSRRQPGGSSTGGNPEVQACVSQLRIRDVSDLSSFIKDSAKKSGKPPAEFTKACIENLKMDTEKDRDLRHKLGVLIKDVAATPDGLAERATLPENRADSMMLPSSLNITGDGVERERAETEPVQSKITTDDNGRSRRGTNPQSFVDRKSYETSVVKRNQAPRVVKHALAHPDEAKDLFSKYINSGNSGPESRLNKLHDAIMTIADPERRSAVLSDFVGVLADSGALLGHALTHLDDAASLFSIHVAGDSNSPGASLQKLAVDIDNLHYEKANKLSPVLDRVLAGMATGKGSEVAEVLLNQGVFGADFAQVSEENELSNQTGLQQLTKDFERGVSFSAPEGVSLATLSEEARAFIGRFANQQSVASLITVGALNLSDRVKDLLEGSGFRLDGWNSDYAGVSYQVSVAESGGVSLSIPTTIALKPTVMSSVESLPICIATLEMSMVPVASGGYAYAVSVAFSPLKGGSYIRK